MVFLPKTAAAALDGGAGGYHVSAMAAHLDFAMLKTTFTQWSDDKAPRLAASLSFAAIFSIAPLLVVIIGVAGYIIGLPNGGHGHHIIEDQLIGQIRSRVGAQSAEAVRAIVAATFSKPANGVIAQIIGWVTFVIGASGIFAALQDALNTIWHVTLPKGRGIQTAIRDRLASLGMVAVIGFLLLLSMFTSTALTIVSVHLTKELPFSGASFVFGTVDNIVSAGIITLLFAVMYKFLPDAQIQWSDVWTGSAITAVLFVVGQAAIGFYIARSGMASAYGASGALLALLIWIYYSSMVLLFGAEFTKVYAQVRGKSVESMAQAAGATVQPGLTAVR
jgi:membrane protein